MRERDIQNMETGRIAELLRPCPHEGFTVVDYTVTATPLTLRVAYRPHKRNVTPDSLRRYLGACATVSGVEVEQTVARIRQELTSLLNPHSLIIEVRLRGVRGTEMCVTSLRTTRTAA